MRPFCWHAGIRARNLRNCQGTCAIVSGGAVKCWGQKGYNLLGNGTMMSYAAPQHVVGSPFTSVTEMVVVTDDGLLVDGSSSQFSIVVSSGGSATGNLHLDATPSATLGDVSWTCTAFGGATCPMLRPSSPSSIAGDSVLDVVFDLPAHASLRFRMLGMIDAAAGGFATMTANLTGNSLPNGDATAVLSVPIHGDGLLQAGFESRGQ